MSALTCPDPRPSEIQQVVKSLPTVPPAPLTQACSCLNQATLGLPPHPDADAPPGHQQRGRDGESVHKSRGTAMKGRRTVDA